MSWSPSVAYNDLPDLPPQVTVETVPVSKTLVTARAEAE